MLKKAVRLAVTNGFTMAAVASLVLLGCAGPRSAKVHAVNDPRADAAGIWNVERVGANASAEPSEYRISTFDHLEIKFFHHERYNGIAIVRPDGRITLESIGDVYVAGLTPLEADSVITAAYSKVLHAPEVAVMVREFGSRAVYVLGEVLRPGPVELKSNMTVLQAIVAVNGPNRGAKMNSVIVLRRTPAGELGGLRIDLSGDAIKAAMLQDQYLLPEDIVFVPKTFIANVNNFLTQVYEGLFPPFDIYLRAMREYNRARP